jgi:hypothetical protein
VTCGVRSVVAAVDAGLRLNRFNDPDHGPQVVRNLVFDRRVVETVQLRAIGLSGGKWLVR